MSVDGVVFDFDGLLADTETAWAVAEGALFVRRGRPFGEEHREIFIGMAVADAAQYMAGLFSEPAPLIEDELRAEAARQLRRHAPPMPGAVELIRALQGRKPVAIASNTPRDLLDLALASSGIGELIGVTVAGDEVPEPKPRPDVYLRACELIGVRPHRAVAIEDSATGAAAARAAGLHVVVVPSLPGTISDFDALHASLADPELTSWLVG
ncbi:MAG: HAD family phosphatase [Micropruina sp.]|nr:HAD family phosphatase [Micropruina sp.]